MHQFPKFTPAWNSTYFGQFLRPSSRVYSLYTRHWYMSYRFEDSFRAGPGWSDSKAVFKHSSKRITKQKCVCDSVECIQVARDSMVGLCERRIEDGNFIII